MMGLLDRLLGRGAGAEPGSDGPSPARGAGDAGTDAAAGRDPDEVAVERYRYLLRTAPPEMVEQAHAEAFAKLTPEQRRQVLAELGSSVPEGERGAADDPRSLARTATRAETREPGTMERALGGGRGAGVGMGGVLAGSLLASVAGAFIGTSIAGAFLDEAGADGGGDDVGGDDYASDDVAGDGDLGGVAYGDPDPGFGGFDDVGGDLEI